MSGDGAGIILGAAVALPAIAVAGVGLVAYGAAQAVIAVGKTALNLYQSHERQVQLQLTSTNREIDSFYRQLDSILTTQAESNTRAVNETQAAILQASNSISTIQADPNHIEQWRQEIQNISQSAYAELHTKIQTAAVTNRTAAQKQIADFQKILDNQLAMQFAVHDMIVADASKKAELQATVEKLIAQCDSAIAQLHCRDSHGLICAELNTYKDVLANAKASMAIHAYGTALSNAQTVLKGTAALACVLAAREQERWDALAYAYLTLDSVRRRIIETEFVQFENPYTGKVQSLYLDDFVGGRLEELLELVEKKQSVLKENMNPSNGTACAFTSTDADLLVKNVNSIVIPEMEALFREASAQIGIYVDRVQCLDTIAKELEKKSSYRMTWSMPEGDDPTAPISMSLHNEITGDEVTITIGTDPASGTKTINTHHFGNNANQIDENYRNAFYKQVVDSLCTIDPDVHASLTCTSGTENTYSKQVQYQNEDSVAEMNVPVPALRSRQILL